MPKLTKRTVDAAAAEPGKPPIIWDSEIKGFGLRISSNGVKAYILQYRTKQGTNRRMTLGRHGVLTPDQARAEAIKHLAAVAQGADPLAEQREERTDMTVAELCDLYFKQPVVMSRRGTVKKASSLETDRSNVERHIKPLLGRKPVRDLKRKDIEQFQNDVASFKS